MICLKVENGIVVNVEVWDECPSGMIEATGHVGIGYADNGDGTFSPPESD